MWPIYQKISDLFQSLTKHYPLSKKDTLSLLVILLATVALPLTIFLLNQQQIIKGRASSTPRFQTGMNLRGATHYGYGDILPAAPSSNIDTNLQEIQRMGGKIVRVFVGNKYISDEEAARRLSVFLEKAATYNISVIPSLIDFYGSNFYPQGTESFYTDSFNGIPLLNHNFFGSGYKDRYIAFLKTVVSYNKNHSNIYAWEPGNELKDGLYPQTFISFMKDVSSTIKSLDPNHPIATGMISSGHTGLFPEQLYPNLPNIDIITVHSYNGEHLGSVDAQWAKANNKRFLWEEGGFSGTEDRSLKLRDEIAYWRNLGAEGFLQWGFIAKGLSDNGDGDRDVGMDAIWHTDYDQLSALLLTYQSIDPIACDPNQVNMNISPNPGAIGEDITFTLGGLEGSTFVEDSWSGGVSCTGGFWGSKTCQATESGSFNWKHAWKNCAPNNCSITSEQCFKTASYTIGNTTTPIPTSSLPSPTQTLSPIPTPSPVLSNTLTVSKIEMFSVFSKGKRTIESSAYVIDEATKSPVPGVVVFFKIAPPTGGTFSSVATTDSNGKATYRFDSKQKGTYTFSILNLSKSGYTYHPTITTKILTVK